jgi:hypothetical protein
MPAAAVLTSRPTAPTKSCYNASCNWAKSDIADCTCDCGGHAHGGAWRETELCACGDIAGECFC